MRIRLAVWVGSASATARTVTLTVPDSCAPEDRQAGAIAAILARTLGVRGDTLSVRDRLLPSSTLLGHPPLVDGGSVRLVTRDEWAPPQRSAPSAASEVAVVSGPDAGHTRSLTAGAHTVGRAGADLTIADPTLSRLHLRLDVSSSGITVTDLGSENGTAIGGVTLRAATAEVAVGTTLIAGESAMVLRTSRRVPAATAARGDGTITVSRAVIPIEDPTPTRISVPAPPRRPDARRIPWVAALLPVPVALLLAWFFGPHLLLFALMSPLMIVGTVLSDRVGSRRRYAEETREHRLAIERCGVRRAAALAAERSWREASVPDLASLVSTARGPGTALWSRPARRDAPLVVRLGRGTVTSAVMWSEDEDDTFVPLTDAPVLLDLAREGSVSITGPSAHRITDSLIGQVVTLHSPTELRVLTDHSGWAAVPHVRHGAAAELIRAADARIETAADASRGAGANPAPHGVLVLAVSGAGLDGDDLDVLSRVCRDGPAHGVLTVATGDEVTATRSRVDAHARRALFTSADGRAVELVADAVGSAWVGRVAAALTPLRDGAGHGSNLPESVALADVVDPSAGPSPSAVSARWLGSDDGAWVNLGVDSSGPLRLDLAAVGPHVIIGGTTGSGKSELLRTIVTSLAYEHPPDDVAIVLIDYKGGSAFAGLEDLPHVVGVVTDLDSALTRRALTSLGAEIHRRERLFAEVGATDIATYRRLCRTAPGARAHLARLVIVVDEFRALADELPDFITGLVRLAAVGRSLGLHLVLATQRPAGVVTADMRANIGLRIALRVRDRTDSQDVIESDDAALLPRSVPGRAILRAGAEPLHTFQTATVTAGSGQPMITAEVSWADGSSTIREFPATHTNAPPDLVALIASAARAGDRVAPPSPWLPALPASIAWTGEESATAWARVDDPASQRQDLALIDLGTLPHTAVCGGLGSGRSTTALTLTLAALAADPDAHVYAIADPAGPLATLRSLPHTGAVIDRADPATLAWFADRLSEEVRQRRSRPGAAYQLVVIDGWDIVADSCDGLDHGRVTDRLLATLREGYALGIRAIVTGDRSVLTGRVSRTFPERYVHRPADDTDLVLAGLHPATAPGHWPPGRLLRASDGMEYQVLRRVGDVDLSMPTRPPWRLSQLPARVLTSELRGQAPGLIAIGRGGDGADPVPVGTPGRRRLLVLGSPGSGRSTTLAALALQAADAGRVVCVVGDSHEDLTRIARDRPDLHCVGWSGHDALVDLRRTHPDLVVVADDLDRHRGSPLLPVLEQIAELAERDGGLIAAVGDSATISLRQRGLDAALARGRTVIVLGSPSPLDHDVVGVRLPVSSEVRPGRGWFVASRRTDPLQVALPDCLKAAALAAGQ